MSLIGKLTLVTHVLVSDLAIGVTGQLWTCPGTVALTARLVQIQHLADSYTYKYALIVIVGAVA